MNTMNSFRLPAEAHIGHVHLQVSSLARSLAFYADLLGFHEVSHEGDTVCLSATRQPPEHILLTELPGARPKPRRSTGLYHVAIRLPNRRGLARVLQRLLAYGWPLQGASDHEVSEALYLSDPDGNGLELYADRPRDRWPRSNGQIAMSTDALDMDGLLAEVTGDETPWTGISPETDIGHVHLHVSDLARAEAFYHELLGLDVTQRSYPGALFLSAGSYHHHLGLNIWAGVGAPPPPPDAVGLLSFGLHIPDAETWHSLLARAREAGVPIEAWRGSEYTMGALIRDPDHIGVELVVDRAQLHPDLLAELQAQGVVLV
jgi:catechol 2,3-dioxygenase